MDADELLLERICLKTTLLLYYRRCNTNRNIKSVQLDVVVSGTAATLLVQAIDIRKIPENQILRLYQMLIFLLESTITSIEVAQV